MRRTLHIVAFLFFSMLGGAIGQTINISDVALGSYQMLAVWTGAAGAQIPSWVSSHWGFGGPVTTSQINGTPFLSVSQNGQIAAVTASRTSDNTNPVAPYTSALNNLCVADYPGVAIHNTWCQYLQGEVFTSMVAGAKQLIMVENSIYNTVDVISGVDPFTPNKGGLTSNYRMDCGTGQTSPAPQNCTTALQILSNGAKYSNPVLIIGNGSIDATTDSNPPAIATPAGYAYTGYTGAGAIGFKIFGGSGSPAGVVSCTARCLYIRTDGAAGSTLYINETGGGTSGWAAK